MLELKKKLEQRIERIKCSKQSLLGFTTFTFPKYEVSKFHGWLSSDLDEFVNDTSINRMMLFAPP